MFAILVNQRKSSIKKRCRFCKWRFSIYPHTKQQNKHLMGFKFNMNMILLKPDWTFFITNLNICPCICDRGAVAVLIDGDFDRALGRVLQIVFDDQLEDVLAFRQPCGVAFGSCRSLKCGLKLKCKQHWGTRCFFPKIPKNKVNG